MNASVARIPYLNRAHSECRAVALSFISRYKTQVCIWIFLLKFAFVINRMSIIGLSEQLKRERKTLLLITAEQSGSCLLRASASNKQRVFKRKLPGLFLCCLKGHLTSVKAFQAPNRKAKYFFWGGASLFSLNPCKFQQSQEANCLFV